MSRRFPDLTKEVLIFDGAMGTMIQRSNSLPAGEPPEILNLSRPEVISAIHREYQQAGCDCIETNTFGGNRLKLEASGLGERTRELNFQAVQLARAVAQDEILVAASLGPTGKMMEPLGELSFESAYEVFLEQCQIFAEAGADLINIETMSDILETKAAILAALEVKLPVMASVSFMENGRLLTGSAPEMVAAALSGFPLAALGTNCGLTATVLKQIVSKLVLYSQKPLIVQPNAGKPELIGTETIYKETPAEFGAACSELVELGVSVIGGCCGTTPEHIRALKKSIAKLTVKNKTLAANDFLVGKNSVLAIQDIKRQWELALTNQNQLWTEFRSGNFEPLTDTVLDIDQEQFQSILIDGRELQPGDKDAFQELMKVLVTYWSNPINAILNSAIFVKSFLTGNPGRGLVYSDRTMVEFQECVSKYGGILRK